MQSAIIHFEPVFSNLDQSLLIKKSLKKVKKEMESEGIKIPVYCLPIAEKKPSQKAVHHFVKYLKENNIQSIIFSEQAKKFEYLLKEYEKEFYIFNGNYVINYKIYDILRKYAREKEMEIGKSTAVLITNSPERAQEVILKIYKFVRKIKIETTCKEKFLKLQEYFLEEYGLFIIFDSKNEKEKNEISILLDNKEIKADLCLAGKNEINLIFACKKEFKEIKKYLQFNQKTLEFIINAHFGGLSEETIKRFFKEAVPKISKIKNND